MRPECKLTPPPHLTPVPTHTRCQTSAARVLLPLFIMMCHHACLPSQRAAGSWQLAAGWQHHASTLRQLCSGCGAGLALQRPGAAASLAPERS